MTRILSWTIGAIVALPMLVAAGLSSAPPPPVRGDVSDLAQVAAVPEPLRGHFLQAARRFALPPALLAAVAKIESSFRPDAVGPPVKGGPALGMMQFLPSSWRIFNVVPGASPFDPGPAVLAGANHLLHSGRLPGGGWDPARGLYGYNRSWDYVRTVLAQAADYGWTHDPARPPVDPSRRAFPVAGAATVGHGGLIAGPAGATVVACVRGQIVHLARTELVLRGEEGWRYHYTGLTHVDPAARAGAVVERGQLLGRLGPAGLRFSITLTPGRTVDSVPYLLAWQGTS